MFRWLRRIRRPPVDPAAVEFARRRATAGLERDRRTVDRHRPVAQSLARAAEENHFSERVRSIFRGDDGAATRRA